jgi:DNA-binding beta-propeller fold protein YncE
LNQNFFFGVPMSFRRVGWVVAIALATWLEISCGQVYRPVVIPTSTTPPNPANFHAVFGISANAPYNPGTVLQIDVSGDTDIGVADMGVNPTHAAILSNHSRVFVASAGSLFAGDTDVVTAFFPAAASSTATGIGTVTTFTLPNVGANQTSGVLSISEDSNNLVTMTISASLINATVGSLIVISGVVIPPGTPPAPGCTNPPATTGYDGSFSISSVSGTTIQFSDPIPCLTAISTPGGVATIPVPLFCSYLPDFVTSSQSSNVYVANFGDENGAHCNLSSTDSVAALDLARNVVGTIAYLPAGAHPVAMVETPNSQNLYVINQGNNTVADLSPTDLTTIATISLPGGSTPVWAVARADNQRIYVLTQGDGNLVPIDTATNTVLQSQTNLSVGAGANFILYDPNLNRLYVTNPSNGTVYVFSASGGKDLGGTANDTPTLLGTLTISAPSFGAPVSTVCASYTCTYSSVMPVSLAALPDGSRFYVSSYVAGTATCTPSDASCYSSTNPPPPTCPDSNVTAPAGCIIPQVTVFDARSLTVKTTIFPLLPPVTTATSTGTNTAYPFALAPIGFCAAVPGVPYTLVPGTPPLARFRMFAAAAADSSRVYASMCDNGAVAIINTTTSTIATGGTNTPDTLVTDLAAPFGAGPTQSNGQPLPQNPVFLLTGQ